MWQYKTLRGLGCNEAKALEIIENYTQSEIDIIIQKLNEKQASESCGNISNQQSQSHNQVSNQVDNQLDKFF